MDWQQGSGWGKGKCCCPCRAAVLSTWPVLRAACLASAPRSRARDCTASGAEAPALCYLLARRAGASPIRDARVALPSTTGRCQRRQERAVGQKPHFQRLSTEQKEWAARPWCPKVLGCPGGRVPCFDPSCKGVARLCLRVTPCPWHSHPHLSPGAVARAGAGESQLRAEPAARGDSAPLLASVVGAAGCPAGRVHAAPEPRCNHTRLLLPCASERQEGAANIKRGAAASARARWVCSAGKCSPRGLSSPPFPYTS